MRLSVFWEDYNAWFDGTVTKVTSDTAHISYDDGDQNVLKLPWETPSLVKEIADNSSLRALQGYFGRQVRDPLVFSSVFYAATYKCPGVTFDGDGAITGISWSARDCSPPKVHSSCPEEPILVALNDLTRFKLSYYDLSGELGKFVFSLTSMTSLDLSNCTDIPSSVFQEGGGFDGLLSLTSLHLYRCELGKSGFLLSSLSKLTALQSINLSWNSIDEELTKDSFGTLTSLSQVDLSYNNLRGTFPDRFGAWKYSLGAGKNGLGYLKSDWLIRGVYPTTKSLKRCNLSNNKEILGIPFKFRPRVWRESVPFKCLRLEQRLDADQM